MNDVRINRAMHPGRHRVSDLCTGLEHSTALLRTFGQALPDVLATTDVQLVEGEDDVSMYTDDDGGIVVGLEHLQTSPDRVLYLDFVHELVHIKQRNAGLHLFDERYAYIDRPTEIEAYRITVEEAKRIGMSPGEILDYLYVEWITNDDVLRLARRCGLAV